VPKEKLNWAGMTNEDYSSNADKTKPEKNAFVLLPD